MQQVKGLSNISLNCFPIYSFDFYFINPGWILMRLGELYIGMWSYLTTAINSKEAGLSMIIEEVY